MQAFGIVSKQEGDKMTRRDFMTGSVMLFSGAAVAGVGGLFLGNAHAARLNSFSIDVVTDHPNLAIGKIEAVIKESALRHQKVKFSEHALHGSHMGDIAYVQSQQLINIHTAYDPVSRHLRDVARSLSLRQKYENPVLLRFYAEDKTRIPTDAQIFSGDVLVKQMPLDKAGVVQRIQNERGHVDVAVENRQVKIVSASCKHKTCMKMGAVDRAGQRLVCIPAQITVAIAGQIQGVDGVTF